jgi:hypothetical protein
MIKNVEECGLVQFNENKLIIMTDGYISRKVKDSFFPFVLPSVLLFEESIKNSPIVRDYKNLALKKPWVFLTLITDCASTRPLFDNEFSVKVINTLIKFEQELISAGPVFVNNIEHCLEHHAKIELTDGLEIWEKNIVFKRIFSKGCRIP